MALRTPVVLVGGELQQLQSGDTIVNDLPTGGSAFQALTKNTGANYDVGWRVPTAVYSALQTVGLNPSAISSTTAVMLGCGAAAGLNPQMTGRVAVFFTGQVSHAVANGALQFTGRWGTGAAPGTGAAVVGTGYGGVIAMSFYAAGVYAPLNWAGIITGLTPGVVIWLDLTIRNFGAAGNGSVSNLVVSAFEF